MAIQNPSAQRLINTLSRVERFQILILGFLFLTLNTPANFIGSDVAGARDNFSNTYRIDFQGAVQTLTYGLVPDFIFSWSTWLLIFQLMCTTLGLTLIKQNLNISNSLNTKIIFIGLTYLAFSLSIQGTRDGTMLSLVVFGLGLYIDGLRRNSRYLLILSILIFLWAGSFRPWIAPAIPLFIFSVSNSRTFLTHRDKLRNYLVRLLIVISFSVSCVSVEYSVSQMLELKSSYPEQQVMVMDLTANYCWGNNPSTALQAQTALANFYANEDFKSNICQFFRPDTWVSLRDSNYPSTHALTTNFSLIKPGDAARYSNLRESWVKLIKNDPVSYIQAKMTFASKLIIGSDSRELSMPSLRNLFSGDPKELKKTAKEILLLPFQIIITFHLLSILCSSLFLLVLLIRQKSNNPKNISYTIPIILGANFLWLILTSIAYIGSNGRYLYLSSFLVFVLTFFNFYRSEVHR